MLVLITITLILQLGVHVRVTVVYGVSHMQFMPLTIHFYCAWSNQCFCCPNGSCFLRYSADFQCDTKFYIGRTLRVTDNKDEIKFLHQVVKTFNWPLRSNIDIVHNRRVFYTSLQRAERHCQDLSMFQVFHGLFRTFCKSTAIH